LKNFEKMCKNVKKMGKNTAARMIFLMCWNK